MKLKTCFDSKKIQPWMKAWRWRVKKEDYTRVDIKTPIEGHIDAVEEDGIHKC